MTLEEKILAYKTLIQEIDLLEEKKKVLSQEILSEMTSKKMEIAGHKIYHYHRLSITTPLEAARLIDATKMTEQIDKEKIKDLYNNGQKIEGVKEIDYLVVSSR